MKLSVLQEKPEWLLWCIALTVGATFPILGDRLEMRAEEAYSHSFPGNIGAVQSCSWIAAVVVLLGLALVVFLAVVVSRIRRTQGRCSLRLWQWASLILSFLLGLCVASLFIPVRG